MNKSKLKNEKGSITLFVLLAILFFLIVIFSVFMVSSNKKQAQTSEIDKIKQEYEKAVDNIDQIYDETLSKNLSNILKVGDYVNYTYDTKAEGYNLKAAKSGYDNDQIVNQKSGMKWRILNIHPDGRVDLIGDISSSDQTVNFKGALGYNNGVYLLNDICKELYSNSTLGVEARSVDLEDIESQMNEEGIAARDAYTSYGVQYGNTKTYTGSYGNYPNLYAQENGSGINTETVKEDGIGVSEDGYTSPTTETSSKANSLTVTQSFYFLSDTPASYFKDYNGSSSIVRDMLFNTGTDYWLAFRCASCFSTGASFGLCIVNSSNLSGDYVFTTSTDSRVRPVVSLDIKQIELCTKKADGADTTIEHMHQIK